MIDSIIGFSIRNKLIISLFVVGLIAWGSYALMRLPIDAVPDITNNQVQVITVSPTLAAQEVERFITYPIETALSSTPRLVELRSISRFGLSVITVVVEDDVDIYLARQQVEERLRAAREAIPAGLGSPELAPVSTGLGEIYQYVLEVEPELRAKYDDLALRTIQDWTVKRLLLGTPGVAEISSFGGRLKQYEIAIDPNKLRSYSLSLADVFHTLESANENTGGAYIEKGAGSFYIRGLGLINNITEVAQLTVAHRNGVPIRLAQVGEARLGSAPRYGAMSRNGEGEAVGGIVLMRKGENSAATIEAVKTRIATIQKALPKGITIKPFLDRTRLINNAINTVTQNLVEGGLIVIFVLVLLLGNFRAGLIVASAIPLSMLFAVGMMHLTGVSGNLMSLGAIDFGLIVDGAVIIVESIVHRIHTSNIFNGRRADPATFDALVLDQAKRIRKSAAFGEVIILIVYLPILSLGGIEGKMFRPMAQTVSFAIIGALILSFTYIPMMSAAFLNRAPSHKQDFAGRIMALLERVYSPVLHLALKLKWLVLGLAVGIFMLALVVFLRMGGEFIPTLEEGDLAVQITLAPGSSLAQTLRTAGEVERILLGRFPEVEQVVSKLGTAEIPTDPMGIETGDIMIILKDKDEWVSASSREELVAKMEEALAVMPGVVFSFQQPIQMRFNELMTGAKTDVAIKIFGEDMDSLAQYAQRASTIVQQIEGAQDVVTERVGGLPQITVQYRPEKLTQYGLTVKELNFALRTAFAGAKAGVVYESERRFDLVVRFADEARSDIENVRKLPVSLANGTQIPLDAVASVEYRDGPIQVSHNEGRRYIMIGLNVRERDVESVVRDIERQLERDLILPPGYTITYGGEFENLQHAKTRLSVALPIALALIFVLLYFTLHTLRAATLIFTAIPLAAVGGIFALWLRDMHFSISAGVGFIALFGVAVLNGIMLIARFNELEAEGMEDPYERVITGAKDRLRPVVMTALVASLGFLPMALSTGNGAEVQRPLATVVIGGLITSTLLTLVLLPIFYLLTAKKRKPNTLGYVAGLIVLFGVLMGANVASAQTASPNTPSYQPKRMALNQILNQAREQSGLSQLADWEVKRSQTLRREAFNLPKTAIDYQYGYVNVPSSLDRSWQVNQQFSFPLLYVRRSNEAKARVQTAESAKQASWAEVSRNIKTYYYQLQSIDAQNRLLAEEDSLLAAFVRAAQVRAKVGESPALELQIAQARYQELGLERTRLATERQIAAWALAKWAGETAPIEPDSYNEQVLPAPLVSAEAEPAYIKVLESELAAKQAAARTEKATVYPDFMLGYFDMTNDGTRRNPILQAGVAVPIWTRANHARIERANVEAQMAATSLRYARQNLAADRQAADLEVRKLTGAIDYYNTTGLALAQNIVRTAAIAFRTGEIDYIAYLQALNQAIKIRRDRITSIAAYNKAVIEREFLYAIEN